MTTYRGTDTLLGEGVFQDNFLKASAEGLTKALGYFYVDSSSSNCRGYFRSVEDCS